MVGKIEERLYHPDENPDHGRVMRLSALDKLTLKGKLPDRPTDAVERLESFLSYLMKSENPQGVLSSLYSSGKVDLSAFQYLRRALHDRYVVFHLHSMFHI